MTRLLSILFILILTLEASMAADVCQLPWDKSARSPASTNPCDTAGELMELNLAPRQFVGICKQILKDDPACKKLKPEKKLSCTTKADNHLSFDLNTSDAGSRIFQCIKGFVWDSMVDLISFIGDLIKTLVGSALKNKAEILQFLIDPVYRAEVLGKGAVKGGRLGKAFLNNSFAYVSREYPRNLKATPLDPVGALGATLAKPLVNFITQSVQSMVKEYVPQYQCMNGAAKLNTICKIAGGFVMPPGFIFSFLKYGVKGLRELHRSRQVTKFIEDFKFMNEAPLVNPENIHHISTLPKPKKVQLKAEKPIQNLSDQELVQLARRQQQMTPKIEDTPVKRLASTSVYVTQKAVVTMAQTPELPIKGLITVVVPKELSPTFITTEIFDDLINTQVQNSLQSLPSSIKNSKTQVYLVMKPENGHISILSPDLNDVQLNIIKLALKKDATLIQLLATQPATKINRHMKITFGGKPQVQMLRPDDDIYIFQNVNKQTFEPIHKQGTQNVSIPISIIDKEADALIASAHKNNLIDWAAIEEFQPQSYRTFCGLASICTLIIRENANLTQEQLMLNNAIIKDPLEVVNLMGSNPGYELDNLVRIAENNGKIATVVKVTDDKTETIELLRENIILSLKENDIQVITNFDGKTLGTTTGGHYSPVAAYDPVTDRALILDVALHRNEGFWIPIKELHKGMKKIDSFGKPRGYLVINNRPDRLPKLPWKGFDDVFKMPTMSAGDALFLRNFLKSTPANLKTKLLKKFQTQSTEATLKDLRAMKDLSRINGACQ